MRTTIELPDDLYRSLKARAALGGVPLKVLIQNLIEQGLRQPSGQATVARRDPPPAIIPPCGIVIPAVPRKALRRMEEDDDVARSARR